MKKLVRSFVATIVLFAVGFSSKAQECKQIVGYYPGWVKKTDQVDYSKYSLIMYSFYFPTESGGLIDAPQDANGPELIPKLVKGAHAANSKVVVSVGGWTGSCPFPAMAANATARKTFAANCVKLIQQYDLDGIDIDWEYPGSVGNTAQCTAGSAADKQNYNLLMGEIREAIDAYGTTVGRKMLLTAAVGAGANRISAVDYQTIGRTLDYILAMTYDYGGAWSANAEHNSPMSFINSARSGFVSAGVPAEKLCIGLGFYGRSVLTNGAGAPGTATTKQPDVARYGEEGMATYSKILEVKNSDNSVSEKWDDNEKCPYISAPNSFMSYDNPKSIGLKCDVVKNNNLGGVLIWEITGDMGTGQNALINEINNKFRPCLSTGIEDEYLTEANISLTPNPFNGAFNLSFSGAAANYSIEIRSAIGQVVYNETVTGFTGNYNKEIDLGNEKSGVYLVTIKNNKSSITKKLVKN